MSLTDEDVAALADTTPEHHTVTRAATPHAAKGKPPVPVTVPEGAIEKAGEQVARMNKIRAALGVDLDPNGAVTLDNVNSGVLTEGWDPEVHSAAAVKRFAINRKRIREASGGEGHVSLFSPKAEPEDIGFTEFGPGFLGLKPADTKRQAEATRQWELIGHLIGPDEEKRGEDPTLYLYPKNAGKASKVAARARLAERFYQAAQTLPPVGNAPEIAAKWRKLGDYIRTLDPAMLHEAHQSMGAVKELADKHASPPVAAAVDHAVSEQSDPERSSILGAMGAAFLNNVAPLTVAGGSAIAQPLGSGRTTGEGTSYIRERLLKDIGGLPPEQQAAALERFKAEHPAAYAAGAAAGWLADPVGLGVGKVFQGVRAALGGGATATGTAAVAAGAPAGVLLGRGAGSTDDLTNAATGVAGELGGQAVAAVLRKVAKAVAGAPARQAARDAKAAVADAAEAAAERVTEARKIHAEVAREAHRQGHDVPRPLLFKRIYERLEEMNPGLPKNQPRRDLATGKMLPPVNGDLAAAVDDAIATSPFGKAPEHAAHGATGAAMGAHPYAALARSDSTVAQKGAAVMHGIGEGRSPITMGMLYASANAGAGAAKLDKGMAILVNAIRSGDRGKFAAAVKEAIHEGVPAASIDAASAIMDRRAQMQQEAGR